MIISSRARRHLAVYGEIVYHGWHMMRDPETGAVHGRRITGWHMQNGCPYNDLGDDVMMFGYLNERGDWIEKVRIHPSQKLGKL